MTANIYNNLFGAILLPLRVVGLKRRESLRRINSPKREIVVPTRCRLWQHDPSHRSF